MVDEDAELTCLHSGGSDWVTGIQARKGRERVRYGSPSSWMSSGGYFGGLEQDLEGFETDDSSSEPGNDYDQSDSSDVQVRTLVVYLSLGTSYFLFICLPLLPPLPLEIILINYEMSTIILRSQQYALLNTLKHCCERRIIVLISLLHAQQDALTQYKD
jgi:hypothetical protein